MSHVADLEFKPKHSHSLPPWSPSNMPEAEGEHLKQMGGKEGSRATSQSYQKNKRKEWVQGSGGEASRQTAVMVAEHQVHGVPWWPAWRGSRGTAQRRAKKGFSAEEFMHQICFQIFLQLTKSGDCSANHVRKQWLPEPRSWLKNDAKGRLWLEGEKEGI